MWYTWSYGHMRHSGTCKLRKAGIFQMGYVEEKLKDFKQRLFPMPQSDTWNFSEENVPLLLIFKHNKTPGDQS